MKYLLVDTIFLSSVDFLIIINHDYNVSKNDANFLRNNEYPSLWQFVWYQKETARIKKKQKLQIFLTTW